MMRRRVLVILSLEVDRLVYYIARLGGEHRSLAPIDREHELEERHCRTPFWQTPLHLYAVLILSK